MPGQPRIAVISYGGTIASAVNPGVGATPSVSMSEIAAHIAPEVSTCFSYRKESKFVQPPADA